MCRSPQGKIIPVNHGQNHIIKTHVLDRHSDLGGFVRIQNSLWVSGFFIAKSAPSGTNITQNHKSRRTRIHALRNIGTLRLFTYCMQLS